MTERQRRRERRKARKLRKETGGSRPRSGRPLGSQNRITVEMREQALKNGITPLDYMLKVLNDEEASTERRDWAAQTAAPYIHPKLQSVVRKDGTDALPDLTKLSDSALETIIAAKRLIAGLVAKDTGGGRA